jgi:sodium transport system permease protein
MLDRRDLALPLSVAIAAVALGILSMGLVVEWTRASVDLRVALLLGQSALIVPLLLVTRAFGRPPVDALAVGSVPAGGLAIAVGCGAALWVASAGLLSLQYIVWPPAPEILKFFQELHAKLDLWPPWSGALSLAAIAIGPALTEEIAFRGALLGSFRKHVGDAGAVVASAMLFGLIHVVPGGYRIPFTFVLGLALGLMRLRTGSILPGAVAHAVLNATTVIVEARLSDHEALTPESAPLAAAVGLLALGAAMAALFIAALPRGARAQRGTLEV